MKYNNVYTIEEENSHRFYQMPKELFINEKYKGLTSDSKILYSILLDRKELSRSNNWVDEFKQVYLIYTRENISDIMGISTRSVQRTFKQLNDYNLIKEERQGLNKPNRIYICRVESHDIKGHANLAHQEVHIWHTNDTEVSETEEIKRYTIGQANDDYVFKYFSFKYKNRYNKEHPTITCEQLDRMKDTVNVFRDEYSVGDEEWEFAIDEHFKMLKQNKNNNGNILGFINGDDMQGSLVRYLDVK